MKVEPFVTAIGTHCIMSVVRALFVEQQLAFITFAFRATYYYSQCTGVDFKASVVCRWSVPSLIAVGGFSFV
jgi:hypothetical protein